MTCSVNLVPVERIQARALARRCRLWMGVCATAALLVAVGWGAQHLTGRALARLGSVTDALSSQLSLGQSRLSGANDRREELSTQLRLIAAARHSQPWAARLMGLTKATPEGVFFTQLEIHAQPVPRAEAASATPRPASATRDTPARPGVANTAYDVRLQGYAVDHTALIELLNRLQASVDWQQVELVRATSEPYAGRMVVAFEFDCRTLELPP